MCGMHMYTCIHKYLYTYNFLSSSHNINWLELHHCHTTSTNKNLLSNIIIIDYVMFSTVDCFTIDYGMRHH